MLPDLESLIDRLKALIEAAAEELTGDLSRHPAFREVMAELLARYHTAAWIVGADSETLTETQRATIIVGVAEQLAFLDGFVLDIRSADEFQQGWTRRAASYAESIKVPYWQGRTKVLPLPAMPAQGTQCLTKCQCLWDVTTINADKGDYDARWVRGANDSCQTCIQRAAEWNPVRIRGGVLQL